MIKKLTVSRDDTVYEAWPDVVLLPSGTLLCVFSECIHHKDRSYARIVLTRSSDRGRTWSAKRPLTEPTRGLPYWNSARITALQNGRVAVIMDKVFHRDEDGGRNYLFFSDDEGETWSEPAETPATGIVPDKLLELDNGRWIVSCHDRHIQPGYVQRLWYSDDAGVTWSDPVTLAGEDDLKLCEVSILPVGNRLVAFLRENSREGRDCYKTVSEDGGTTWSSVVQFPLPGCHRPVSGRLRDGRILITYRFCQGGQLRGAEMFQNFFVALTDDKSALASERCDAYTRILPIDYDRSPEADTGYSGWVQFEDGEIFIVNYIVDDAPKGQIRGYSVSPAAFILPAEQSGTQERAADPVQLERKGGLQ